MPKRTCNTCGFREDEFFMDERTDGNWYCINCVDEARQTPITIRPRRIQRQITYPTQPQQEVVNNSPACLTEINTKLTILSTKIEQLETKLSNQTNTIQGTKTIETRTIGTQTEERELITQQLQPTKTYYWEGA